MVPRTWTHLIARRPGARSTRSVETPPEWREYTRARTDISAPERMTDGAAAEFVPFSSGYDPADAVDRAIMATRTAVFPWHGLFPSP